MLNFEVLFKHNLFILIYVPMNTSTHTENPMPKCIEMYMPVLWQLFEVLNTIESSILNVMERKIECTHFKIKIDMYGNSKRMAHWEELGSFY